MSFFITILGLGIVIFIHELGHMLAAKWSGIGVYEFAIGMGPKIWSKKWRGTMYSLRMLPVGGFVKLAGVDDDEDEKAPPELSFYHKPWSKRLLTIAAGSMMNLLLGFLIFVGIFTFIGVPRVSNEVQGTFPDSPAAEIGLTKGDKIMSLEGRAVTDMQKDFIAVVNKSVGIPLALTIERAGVAQTFTVTPKAKDKDLNIGLIGVELGTALTRYNPVLSIGYGLQATWRNITLVFKSLGMLFSGRASFKEMAGPVGIVQFASFSLGRGILQFLQIMAMISISLGVVNLFPFPVLDGGHLAFLLIEKVRGRALNKKWERVINNMGAAVLISLMVLIVLNDLVHWRDRVDLLHNLSK